MMSEKADGDISVGAHGCSLKIHRVEISVADGNRADEKSCADRAVSNILIASKRIFNFEARVSNRVEYGITRQVRDLTDIP